MQQHIIINRTLTNSGVDDMELPHSRVAVQFPVKDDKPVPITMTALFPANATILSIHKATELLITFRIKANVLDRGQTGYEVRRYFLIVPDGVPYYGNEGVDLLYIGCGQRYGTMDTYSIFELINLNADAQQPGNADTNS